MRGSNEVYGVNDCYSTIQGEGALTGTPMMVLRLQGCRVGCPWCDTKETWAPPTSNIANSRPIEHLDDWRGANVRCTVGDANDIVEMLRMVQSRDGFQHKWVMLTGGEPCEYPLAPLTAALHEAGYLVALETSGTAHGLVGANIDYVCLSPKVGMPGRREVLGDAVLRAHEIKWPVGKKQDVENLKAFLAKYRSSCHLMPNLRISVQPLSQGQRATKLCIATAKEHNWCLSIQIHKYLGIE